MASAHRVACVLLSESSDSFQSFAEACGRFTPYIALRSGEAVFLEIGGSAKLYSEGGLPAKITALAQRFGIRCRVAIADTAPMALAMARYPRPGSIKRETRDSQKAQDAMELIRHLPLQALFDYALPFVGKEEMTDSQRRMVAKVTAMIHVLDLLGVRDLAGFAALPRETLTSRFGKEAVQLSARVWGQADLAWPTFHPQPKIEESEDLQDVVTQGGTTGLDALIFVLKGMMDRASARLRGRGERASVIQIDLEMEKWSVIKVPRRQWKIALPLPQGATTGLLPIVQERLAHDLGREGLQAPVRIMKFTVLETVPGRGAQQDFFSKKEEEAEAWNALVGRLAHKLGKDRVFVARPVERYLPERSYVRNLEGPEQRSMPRANAAQWPDRPARLLKRPEPLVREGQLLVHPQGKRWRVLDWNGPERLSGEWWKDPELTGFDRDYYQAITENGEKLWVFLNRKSQQYPQQPLPSPEVVSVGMAEGIFIPGAEMYLHGFFD